MKPLVRSMEGYDIVPTPFSTCASFPAGRHVDLLCAFDVIEHLDDIDDIWSIDFEVGFFSLPCPPMTGITTAWRHWKPNEHLWHLTPNEFTSWINYHGYDMARMGSPEDAIRSRWDPLQMNIASYVVEASWIMEPPQATLIP